MFARIGGGSTRLSPTLKGHNVGRGIITQGIYMETFYVRLDKDLWVLQDLTDAETDEVMYSLLKSTGMDEDSLANCLDVIGASDDRPYFVFDDED